MVENLQSHGVITSDEVAKAMEAVDRGLFVPDRSHAYVDSPLSIGYNVTISAPHMHAMCLQLLENNLKPGMRVLDVGSGLFSLKSGYSVLDFGRIDDGYGWLILIGTGYLTACFAVMVGSEGRVIGVEHIPELVASSIKNIEGSAAASPLLKEGSLAIHVGGEVQF